MVAAAIERGDLIESCSDSIASPSERTDPQSIKTIENVQNQTGTTPISDSPMDDSRFCGTRNLLTLESARSCIDSFVDFVQNNCHDRFRGELFSPIWHRLKEQGAISADTDLKWKLQRNKNPLARCIWCFVPPRSHLGVKGQVGKDYFETEEQFVLEVLKEVRALEEVSHMIANHLDSFSAVLDVLQRAVDENLEYLDAKLGNG